jgi:hypothetical protein
MPDALGYLNVVFLEHNVLDVHEGVAEAKIVVGKKWTDSFRVKGMKKYQVWWCRKEGFFCRIVGRKRVRGHDGVFRWWHKEGFFWHFVLGKRARGHRESWALPAFNTCLAGRAVREPATARALGGLQRHGPWRNETDRLAYGECMGWVHAGQGSNE